METDDHGHSDLKACRAELSHREVDWQQTWKLECLPGLSSEDQTFLWRMLYNILPTQARLHRLWLRNAPTPNCTQCDMLEPEVLSQALLTCPKKQEVTLWLLNSLQPYILNPQPQNLVLLNLGSIDKEDELTVVRLVLNVLSITWQTRKDRKMPNLFQTRSTLEERFSILRKSRYLNTSMELSNMLNTST